MTGLDRMAAKVPMYNTALTSARPPKIVRLPRHVPLSRLNGHTPTSALIWRRFNVPNSGKAHSKVVDSTGPTPLALVSMSSFSRHTGLALMARSRSLLTLPSRFSSQAMVCLMSLWTRGWAPPKRFFSAVSMSTIWRRRTISAFNAWVCASLRGRGGGLSAWPNRARVWASIASVLASVPQALAKSRIWRGFITATGNPAAVNRPVISISKPPVASNTMSCGLSPAAQATNSPPPASSLAKLCTAPVGNTATSKRALLTSMPMNRSCTAWLASSLRMLLSPNLVRYGLIRPRQLFGLNKKDVTICALPRATVSIPKGHRSVTPKTLTVYYARKHTRAKGEGKRPSSPPLLPQGEGGEPRAAVRGLPPPEPSALVRVLLHSDPSALARDFIYSGRREWDRTTDHHHVKVVLYH